MQDCLFCKIANGEIPSKILYQDAEAVAFADINPQAPHHVLLIPRRHLASMKEVTEQDGALLATSSSSPISSLRTSASPSAGIAS